MGMFRVLIASLPCSRCGKPRKVAVQFKTGHDDLQSYLLGQRVSRTDELPVGGRYDGIAERYCDSCLLEWRCAEEACYLETLAALAERQQIRVERWREPAEWSPGQLRLEAAKRVRQLRNGSRRLHDLDVRTLFKSRPAEPLLPTDPFYERAWQLVDTSFHRRMSARGWKESYRQDLKVVLDGSRRIRLRVLRRARSR
jgi:hypothetical protein